MFEFIHGLLQALLALRVPPSRRRRQEAGQATAEYALVLLAAASVALLLLAWATKSGQIGKLFDLVFTLIGRKLT